MAAMNDLVDVFLFDLDERYGIRPRAKKKETVLATMARLKRTLPLTEAVLARHFWGISRAVSEFGETLVIGLFRIVLPLLHFPGDCSPQQSKISSEADARAAPYGIDRHLTKNFPDHRASWLMKEADFERYVRRPHATEFGRCLPSAGCHQFAAPAPLMRNAIARSDTGHGSHDPKILAQSLGLQPDNMTGPLRLMTLDYIRHPTCVRLPVESDPGALNCDHLSDSACFRFGGFTTGGVPEVMLIDAPVKGTRVRKINSDQLCLAESIVRDFSRIQRRLSHGSTLTLIHGDIKSANIFYRMPTDGNGIIEPYFIDWQYIARGKGVQDLAFFMIESFSTSIIASRIERFKRHYFEAFLNASGLWPQQYPYSCFEKELYYAARYYPFFVAIWFGTLDNEDLIDIDFPRTFILKLFGFYALLSTGKN